MVAVAATNGADDVARLAGGRVGALDEHQVAGGRGARAKVWKLARAWSVTLMGWLLNSESPARWPGSLHEIGYGRFS
jgi:hypothetical protein